MQTLIRIFIFCVLTISLSSASVEDGVDWLTQHTTTQADIEENTHISTPLQSINEAFSTLCDLNESYGSIALPVLESNTTEELSRIIIMKELVSQDSDLFVAQLLMHQNKDGGFGELEGYDSTVLDTAFAIRALVNSSTESDSARKAVEFIKRKQHSNGAWVDHLESDTVYITMLALNALYVARQNNSVKDNLIFGRGYLLEHRDSTDLWGENYLDAFGLTVLLPLVSEKTILKSHFDHILASQKMDGSWDEGIFTTALALKALDTYLNKVYDSSLDPYVENEISIEGQARDSRTGEAISGVQVVLSGANSKTTITDTEGKYKIIDLVQGVTQVSFNLEGYQSVKIGLDLKDKTRYTLDRNLKKKTQEGAHRISIEGEIRDSHSEEPLSGVQIVLSGANSKTAITDTEGKYRITDLVDGTTQIHLSLKGYTALQLGVELKDNTAYVFNKNLYKTVTAEQINVLIRGVVISEQNLPISDATITIKDMSLSGTTEGNGSFAFHDVTLSNDSLTISASAEGFDAQSIFVTIENLNSAMKVIDLGNIVLTKPVDNNDTNMSVVSGKITDDQGNPLEQVRVSVAGSEISVFSDNNGAYSITKSYHADAVARNDYAFSLVFERDGFINGYQSFNVVRPEKITYDILLKQFKDQNLTIDQIALNKENYHGYETAEISVHIRSLGTLSQQVNLLTKIMYEGDEIETIMTDRQHNSLQDILLLPNLDTHKELGWHTGIHKPGEYKVVVTLTDSDHAILAKKEKTLRIDPSVHIHRVRIKVAEHLYYKGETKNVVGALEILNYANVSHTLRLKYYLRAPSGKSSESKTVAVSLKANELIKKVSLDALSVQFDEEGTYQMIVEVLGGATLQEVINDDLVVLPPFHIVPSQTLTPKVITPSSSQKIKIMIHIRGEQ